MYHIIYCNCGIYYQGESAYRLKIVRIVTTLKIANLVGEAIPKNRIVFSKNI